MLPFPRFLDRDRCTPFDGGVQRILLLGACALAIAGCRPTKLAGESLGQFAVTGTLIETTCGQGHPAPASFSFYVELREEPGQSTGYWKLADGPLVTGSIDRHGVFRFESRQQVTGVEPDAANGVVGCVLERAEVVRAELTEGSASDASAQVDGGADAGVESERPFEGETTVNVSPVVGSDCSPLLLPYGGAFPTLPCQIRYELEGDRLDEPLW